MNRKIQVRAILAVLAAAIRSVASGAGGGHKGHKGQSAHSLAQSNAQSKALPELEAIDRPRPARISRIATIVWTLVVFGVLSAAGAGAFVYFGIYNIAATEQHTPPVYYLLHYAMKRSVSARAEDVQVPDLSDPAHARNGFALYREHCVQCHGAPGVSPDPVGFGIRPAPANLVEASREWKASEIYWVVKHGVKMTGMAAWKYRLTEEELWDLTAFVKLLPALSPADYKEWDRTQPRTPASPPAATVASGSLKPGNAQAGEHAIQQYLCITCHAIPGVTGANKQVGPPLDGIASRKFIGGVLPNTQENMMRWLRDPQEVDPLSAMPNLNIKEQDVRDITAYLYTLDKPSQ